MERLGESGATHDSQSASRSGVEAWVARNLNGWDDSDAGLSQGWVRCPSGLASLHHSRLSTRSSYQLYSFSGDRRFCYDNHGSFVYDSPNLFCGPSGSVRTGLMGVRSEPRHRTHLTSLIRKKKTAQKMRQELQKLRLTRWKELLQVHIADRTGEKEKEREKGWGRVKGTWRARERENQK